MSTATQLSQNDLSVLSVLFNPEDNQSTNSLHDSGSHTSPEDQDSQQLQANIIASLNSELPSQHIIREAIAALDQLLQKNSRLCSAYNNRAQARRLLQQSIDPKSSADGAEQIWNDLAEAIRLAHEDDSSAQHARVLAEAHTHRGYLLYRASKDQEAANVLPASISYLRTDRTALEEMASRDFALGGQYGNKIGRQMAVLTDPYGKLCGQIVKQALGSST